MQEIVWQYDPMAQEAVARPQSALEARARLNEGSTSFAALGTRPGRHIVRLSAGALGRPTTPNAQLLQEPFAAVLGCSDARVPAELVLGQAANDLFVVRVAGNVPGADCLGSLDYAVANLPTLRLVTVLGHTGCGAVTAAIDAYLHPEVYFATARNPNLRGIIDAVMAAVTTSAEALARLFGAQAREMPGYRHALTETTVVVNAALTASLLAADVTGVRPEPPGVVYGVYHLGVRAVGIPSASGWQPGLADPPASAAELRELALRVAAAYPPG